MLGFAEHPWCHPAALRAAGMTALRAACSSRHPENAFGDDVALDLVRACVDWAREREQVAVEPRADFSGGGRLGEQLPALLEDPQRGLVHAQIELGPEDLVQARLGADLRTAEQPRHGAIGLERVGLALAPPAAPA